MAISKFRDMRPYREQATSLTQVALVPEVQKTLLRWVASVSSPNMVLIGGPVNTHPTASVDGWPLSEDLKERFNSIKKGTFEIK